MNENELKALVSLLDDEDKEVRAIVENKLLELGESIVPFLEENWIRELSENTRQRIEEMVANIQKNLLQTRFEAWVQTGGEDLLQGVWLVATYQYPNLKKEDLLQYLDKLYYEIWFDLRESLHPFDQISIFNHHFFGKYKFRGNNKEFHAVGNSMINIVLETKKGSPILICVIYLLVAQRLKLPLFGVNLPNLFILTYKTEGMQFYVNAFNRGLIFSRSDIDSYLSKLNLNPNPIFYEPCSHIDIVQRILRNLAIAYEKVQDEARANEIRTILEWIS